MVPPLSLCKSTAKMLQTMVRVFILICAIAMLIVAFREFDIYDNVLELINYIADWFHDLLDYIRSYF